MCELLFAIIEAANNAALIAQMPKGVPVGTLAIGDDGAIPMYFDSIKA